ncbi:MAG: hypothetical protein U0167_04150 [bacterium]
MRRFALRDVALIAVAVLGLHVLLIALPSRLARPEPSIQLLRLTAPDCATLLKSGGAPGLGGFRGGLGGPIAPASPLRR